MEENMILEKTICQDSSMCCALAGAILSLSGLQGSAIIIHGSPGCAWVARWMRSDHALRNYTPTIASALFEHEVIFGGKDKLTKLMTWVMGHWKPDQLFITNGCTGSLISDPVQIIAAEFEKKYGKPVIYIDTGGFRGLTSTGCDMGFSAMLSRFARKDIEKVKDSVNIIAPFLTGSNNWVYDLDDIERIIKSLGLNINCVLTHNTPMKNLENFNQAEANIYLTYESLPELSQYEDENNIRRIGLDLPLPIGIANTETWYYRIADEFNKRELAEEFLKNERKALRELRFMYNSTWLTTWLSSKYAAIIGPATWASSFANFLYYDMAVYPAVIALYGEGDDTIKRARAVLSDLEKYYKPVVLENPLLIQALEAAKNAKVEFSIGQTQEKSLFEGNGISHLCLAGFQTILGAFNFIPYPSVGFRGVLYLLTMLGRLVEQAFHEPKRWRDLRFRGVEEGDRED